MLHVLSGISMLSPDANIAQRLILPDVPPDLVVVYSLSKNL
jgi:hypothetical protein